jgi:hypothetical protein
LDIEVGNIKTFSFAGDKPRGLEPAWTALEEHRLPNNVAVVRDGAEALKSIKCEGAIPIAQDRESSVVHGMPGEAIEPRGSIHVLAADVIAGTPPALVRGGQAARGIERSVPV